MRFRLPERLATACVVVIAYAGATLLTLAWSWPVLLLLYIGARKVFERRWADLWRTMADVAQVGIWLALLLAAIFAAASVFAVATRWLGPARLQLIGRLLGLALTLGAVIVLMRTCDAPAHCTDGRYITC